MTVPIKERSHREQQGVLDEAFALAYLLFHQPTHAPDTREITAAPCAEVLGLHFDKKRVPLAIEMCNACTIKNECLKTAIDSGVEEGVWGGVHFG